MSTLVLTPSTTIQQQTTTALFRDPIGEYLESNHAPLRLEGEFSFLHLRADALPASLKEYGAGVSGLIAGHSLVHAVAYPRADLPKMATYLPNGPWFGWLESILKSLGASMDLDRMILRATPSIPFLMPVEFETIDSSAAIVRRRVRWAMGGARGAERPNPEIELVHLPTDHEARVALVTEHLLANGFVPVGIRPGTLRSDEIVFQRLSDPRAAARDALERSSRADAAGRAIVESWAALVTR